MQVQWDAYWATANGRFLDVFEPIEGLEFVESGATEKVWWAADGPDTWHRHYKLLRPTAALRERISGIREAIGPYDAMHVRRTDHVLHSQQYGGITPDSHFLTWARQRSSPVFLATDNAETRRVMLDGIGSRLIYQGPMSDSYAYRHESQRFNSIADAVVDLFVCVAAEDFIGSAFSSFTDLIHHLRAIR